MSTLREVVDQAVGPYCCNCSSTNIFKKRVSELLEENLSRGEDLQFAVHNAVTKARTEISDDFIIKHLIQEMSSLETTSQPMFQCTTPSHWQGRPANMYDSMNSYMQSFTDAAQLLSLSKTSRN